jgi:hypothetical protein
LLVPLFFLLKFLIASFGDKASCYALIIKAKPLSITILWYWDSTYRAKITPLTTLCTQRGMST